MTDSSANTTVVIDGHRLEYTIVGEGDATPRLVFLHEGLGSINLWRGYPAAVAASTGQRALIYSRYGHGFSDPLTETRRPAFFRHEANVVLPQLLERFTIESPILIGHSDGGSISLIYAGSGRPLTGAVVLAPHVFVEEEYLPGVEKHAELFETTDLSERMGKYHANPSATFHGWGDLWLSEEFRSWNIEDVLSGITVPLLAFQGLDDQYGSIVQTNAIARGVSGAVTHVQIPNCGHSPHLDHPESVAAQTADFIDSLV